MVVQDFTAVDENEISVSNGELVMIENSDDPQWFWVKRLMALKEEGFIPSRCLRKVSYPSSRKCKIPTLGRLIGFCISSGMHEVMLS